MPLWRKFYNTVWLAFFCCVLLPRWMGGLVGLPLHALLGLMMLVITQSNAKRLGGLPVPDRLKRISKAIAGFAVFQLIAGIALGVVLGVAPKWPLVPSALRGIHIVAGLAILAKASSMATGYDMWEEKEFGAAPAAG